MKHYIVTRLCVDSKFQGFLDDKQEWLDYRLNLFNDFYVKGMESQTNKNFEVVLLVSAKYKNLDFSKFNIKTNMSMFFFEGSWREDFSNRVIKHLDQDETVITSRVDSDDMLCQHYVENIQKNARIDSIMDHNCYYMVDKNFKKSAIISTSCNSMFISTCFKARDFVTKNVCAYNHRLLKDKPFWKSKKKIIGASAAAVCHGANSNTSAFRRKAKQDVNVIKFKSLFPLYFNE